MENWKITFVKKYLFAAQLYGNWDGVGNGDGDDNISETDIAHRVDTVLEVIQRYADQGSDIAPRKRESWITRRQYKAVQGYARQYTECWKSQDGLRHYSTKQCIAAYAAYNSCNSNLNKWSGG